MAIDVLTNAPKYILPVINNISSPITSEIIITSKNFNFSCLFIVTHPFIVLYDFGNHFTIGVLSELEICVSYSFILR